MVEMNSQDQEQQVKKLMRLLEGWRMALVPLKSVLLWEQQWHPAALVGTVTFLHLFLWLLDLNFLTAFAVIGLFINSVDFIVPVICTSICNPNSWTGQHEKMYEEMCKNIVGGLHCIINKLKAFYSLRENSPLMYYLISISMLCTLVWISANINNIFLLYLLSTTIVLWPGIQQKGIFKAITSMLPISKAVKAD